MGGILSLIQIEKHSIHDSYLVEGKKVGEGSYGAIRIARHRISGEIIAAKCIPRKIVRFKAVLDAIKEAKLMQRLDHPNIARCLSLFKDEDNIYIMMEYLSGGNLIDKIMHVKYFDENRARDVIKSILSAIGYCHERGIVHRDIKPDNILLENGPQGQMKVKLTDFGLAAKTKGDTCMVMCGSLPYLAPEIVIGARYGKAVDIWALGVTTYVILCGSFPFDSDDGTTESLFAKIHKSPVSFSSSNHAVWETVSSEAKDFIKRLLTKSPRKRITAAQALAHPWMTMTKPSEGLCCGDITMENLTAVQEDLKSCGQQQQLERERTYSFSACKTISHRQLSAKQTKHEERQRPAEERGQGQKGADESLTSRTTCITVDEGDSFYTTTTTCTDYFSSKEVSRRYPCYRPRTTDTAEEEERQQGDIEE
jgi:serine/threonine protein kinase